MIHCPNIQTDSSLSIIQNKLDDIEWSDGRRVDCILLRCIHHMSILYVYAYDIHASYKLGTQRLSRGVN